MTSLQGTVPETLLVDTSYLGVVQAAIRRPYLTAAWPTQTVTRIASAVLAISVITIAEERAGEIKAGWGAASVAHAAQRRKSFLLLPLDAGILEQWAALDAHCKSQGIRGCDDNDLWIVATGVERNITLITCDKNQAAVPTPRPPIYLPPGQRP